MDTNKLIERFEKEKKLYRQFQRASSGDHETRYNEGISWGFELAIDIIEELKDEEKMDNLEEITIDE